MSIYELYADVGKHLMEDNQPSKYLNTIYYNPMFAQHPFDMLYKLKNTEQSPVYHPEGNVWNHTMLVVDEAAKVKTQSKNSEVFMWAALLHDIGKPPTTKIRKGKITTYDHDEVGANLSKVFLNKFTKDEEFVKAVSQLIKYHMHILYVIKKLPFADIKGMVQNTDINEVALLGLCDRLGRTNSNKNKEEKDIELFLKMCEK